MKCALITGASRGIGRALAREIAAAGTYPMLCLTGFHHAEALSGLGSELSSLCPGLNLILSCGDVGDHAYVQKLKEEIAAAGGTVSLLVNNAGIAHYGLLADMTPGEWDLMVRTNLTSLYNTCSIFQSDLLRAGEARVINISSVWGAVGASCEVAYSAAKGGVTAFTKALARELAPSHIAVNCIELGAVDTEMNGHLQPEERSALEEEIPFGRYASPEEAAKAILRLSEMPLYVTGAVLRMDGAWV